MKTTPAYLLGVALLCSACGGVAAPAPAPDAGSSHPPPRAPTEETRGPQELRSCVFEGGRLRDVPATYAPATGDTLPGGRPFGEAFPDTVGYAAGKEWYVSNEPIVWEDRSYVKYGRPRALDPRTIRPAMEYHGVVLFTELADPDTPDLLLAPTGPGCLFQPYQYDLVIRSVRG